MGNYFLFHKIFILYALGIFVIPEAIGGHVREDYPLVRDDRNFRESHGGKGVPPQGRLIDATTKSYDFNMPNFAEAPPHNWRYVVAINCRRSDDILRILQRLERDLLPEQDRKQLGILIGINERVTLDIDPDYTPSWEEILQDHASIQALGVPITAVYTQWTAFREDPRDRSKTAQQVREEMHARLNTLHGRQKETERKKIIEEDKGHQYPFGHMRAHVLNCDAGTEFLKKMQGSGPAERPVYIHIQDSDFQDLRTQPLFYGGMASKSVPQVISQNQPLLSRYTALLLNQSRKGNMLPLFVGGAHVYSPEEVLEETTSASRYWTRFSSEMGNMLKQSMGCVQPYGIYFHEPNTLILSPHSLHLVNQDASAWALIEERFRYFSFGIDSEIQDFSRKIMEKCADDTCRQLMIFSADTILATSMKRGGAKRDFSLTYGGDYDPKNNIFSGWSIGDIKAIHGMPQEVMHPNKWMSMVCTGFQAHRKVDSRTQIASAFNFFDPYARSNNERGFWKILVEFDDIIGKAPTSQTIKDLFQHLCGAYDKQGQGSLMAFYILSQAWEAAQIMRIMFLDHLHAPEGVQLKVPALEDIRQHLAYTRTFRSEAPYPIIPNQVIIDILGLGKIPTTILPMDAVTEVVRALYAKKRHVKKATADVLETTPSTVTKLLEGKSPIKGKEIYKAITGTPEQTLKAYGFNREEAYEIQRSLF